MLDKDKMLKLYYQFLRDLEDSMTLDKQGPVRLEIGLKDGRKCCIKVEVEEVKKRLAVVEDDDG